MFARVESTLSGASRPNLNHQRRGGYAQGARGGAHAGRLVPPGTGAPAMGSGGIPPGLYSQGPRKRNNEGRKEVENPAGEVDVKTRKMTSSRSVEALDGRA